MRVGTVKKAKTDPTYGRSKNEEKGSDPAKRSSDPASTDRGPGSEGTEPRASFESEGPGPAKGGNDPTSTDRGPRSEGTEPRAGSEGTEPRARTENKRGGADPGPARGGSDPASTDRGPGSDETEPRAGTENKRGGADLGPARGGSDPANTDRGPGSDGTEARARASNKKEGTNRETEPAYPGTATPWCKGNRAVTSPSMASQKIPRRKSTGAEGESLAPVALAKIFGEDEDTMEIESSAQSLKKLLEEKTKTQPRGPGYPKRAREITLSSPNAESASLHQAKIKF